MFFELTDYLSMRVSFNLNSVHASKMFKLKGISNFVQYTHNTSYDMPMYAIIT